MNTWRIRDLSYLWGWVIHGPLASDCIRCDRLTNNGRHWCKGNGGPQQAQESYGFHHHRRNFVCKIAVLLSWMLFGGIRFSGLRHRFWMQRIRAVVLHRKILDSVLCTVVFWDSVHAIVPGTLYLQCTPAWYLVL